MLNCKSLLSGSILGKGVRLKISVLRTTRHWWFTPIILATWEAEIKRMEVQGQSAQTI
jgi:hypothetical protein